MDHIDHAFTSGNSPRNGHLNLVRKYAIGLGGIVTDYAASDLVRWSVRDRRLNFQIYLLDLVAVPNQVLVQRRFNRRVLAARKIKHLRGLPWFRRPSRFLGPYAVSASADPLRPHNLPNSAETEHQEIPVICSISREQ